MNKVLARLFLIGASVFILISIGAYFIGKYRTSFYAFDFSFCCFALFIILSCVEGILGGKMSRKWWVSILVISVLVLTVVTSNFIDFLRLEEKKTYQEWVLKAKEKGKVLELPTVLNSKEDSYRALLIQNQLQEQKNGYFFKDIFPQFTRLTWDYMAQLQFLGVKYVVAHLRKGKEKTLLQVDRIPVAATFDKTLIFKVPKRKRSVTVLYGSEFDDKLVLRFPEQTKWVASEKGQIYLHNHGFNELNIDLNATFVSQAPAQLKLIHENSNLVLWEGDLSEKVEPILIKNLTLLPGKNTISLIGESQKETEGTSIPLVSPGRGIGVVQWEIKNLGISPQEVAASIGKPYPKNSQFQRWLKSLPQNETLLEYPLAYLNWDNPIAYGLLSEEHRNVNFKFDSNSSKFAAKKFGNEPTPALAWWARYLGIDYIVIHTALYEWPPRVSQDSGWIPVAQFGEALVYRPQPYPLTLESEEAPSQAGVNVVDSEAKGSMARLTRPDMLKNPNPFMVFGPHAPLEPGRYRATYRLKVEQIKNKELATIDVCTDQGNQILVQKKIDATQFEKPLQYQKFVLEFQLAEPKLVEFRVQYLGQESGLWSDHVLVEKI